eukprot:scaffold109_cov252-Pinguiococcus_pyrenoidosus.AAC.96
MPRAATSVARSTAPKPLSTALRKSFRTLCRSACFIFPCRRRTRKHVALRSCPMPSAAPSNKQPPACGIGGRTAAAALLASCSTSPCRLEPSFHILHASASSSGARALKSAQ